MGPGLSRGPRSARDTDGVALVVSPLIVSILESQVGTYV